MKCILFTEGERIKETEFTIGESIRVGDYIHHNKKDYDVTNILLDAFQEYPIVVLKEQTK